jgi:hypothetical protein
MQVRNEMFIGAANSSESYNLMKYSSMKAANETVKKEKPNGDQSVRYPAADVGGHDQINNETNVSSHMGISDSSRKVFLGLMISSLVIMSLLAVYGVYSFKKMKRQMKPTALQIPRGRRTTRYNSPTPTNTSMPEIKGQMVSIHPGTLGTAVIDETDLVEIKNEK